MSPPPMIGTHEDIVQTSSNYLPSFRGGKDLNIPCWVAGSWGIRQDHFVHVARWGSKPMDPTELVVVRDKIDRTQRLAVFIWGPGREAVRTMPSQMARMGVSFL